MTQLDWDGNVVWKFDHKEYIEDEGKEPMWMARQHHDYQREGNPVGYYVPGMESKTDGGNTLILCHETIHDHKISDKQLLDDACERSFPRAGIFSGGEECALPQSEPAFHEQW